MNAGSRIARATYLRVLCSVPALVSIITHQPAPTMFHYSLVPERYGHMNIFQPAIDITQAALQKEITDIESELAAVRLFAVNAIT